MHLADGSDRCRARIPRNRACADVTAGADVSQRHVRLFHPDGPIVDEDEPVTGVTGPA